MADFHEGFFWRRTSLNVYNFLYHYKDKEQIFWSKLWFVLIFWGGLGNYGVFSNSTCANDGHTLCRLRDVFSTRVWSRFLWNVQIYCRKIGKISKKNTAVYTEATSPLTRMPRYISSDSGQRERCAVSHSVQRVIIWYLCRSAIHRIS